MKTKCFAVILALCCMFGNAQNRFEKAKNMAKENKELIVLNFSGSDWCVPCIKLHNNILDTDTFKKLSKDSIIVYVNADFPRSKKNQPSAEIRKENAALADQYNKNGIFPLTLLLNSDGKILKSWEGLPAENAESFTKEILSFYKKK